MKLTTDRADMMHRWEDRWEYLRLILEVYQFARDAAVAEAWLDAQEPYLRSRNFGRNLEEVWLGGELWPYLIECAPIGWYPLLKLPKCGTNPLPETDAPNTHSCPSHPTF